MRVKENKGLHYVYAFVGIMVLWQVASMAIDTSIFPGPLSVTNNIVENFGSEMFIHVVYSLKRIFWGILFALMGGIPLGIWMGYDKRVDSFLSPVLYFVYPVPKMALLPMMMLLFGLGEVTKVGMIFLITFFVIVVNIRDEVRNIPEELFYSLNSLGGTKIQKVIEIILPSSIPSILTSLRVGMGTAISILFFTENFGTEYGMGYFIMDAWMRINYVDMFSGIFVLSIMGLLIFTIIDVVESVLCPWKNK